MLRHILLALATVIASVGPAVAQSTWTGNVSGAKNIPYLERDPAQGMTLNPRFAQIVEKNFGKGAKLICGCQKGGRSFKAALGATLEAARLD